MLTILFVETALELVPGNISGHPSVVKNARRQGKRPEETLLDRSLHHRAMLRLPMAEKKGRPDIIHFCLLEALGSPLNRKGGLTVWAHTQAGVAIEVARDVRVPRDCLRFNSLMERLLVDGQVPPAPEKPLMSVHAASLGEIKARIKPSRTVALTSHGAQARLDDLCVKLAAEESALVFIGAYPHGPMQPETLSQADEAVSIYSEPLEAWTVTSRLVYEYEKASGVT